MSKSGWTSLDIILLIITLVSAPINILGALYEMYLFKKFGAGNPDSIPSPCIIVGHQVLGTCLDIAGVVVCSMIIDGGSSVGNVPTATTSLIYYLIGNAIGAGMWIKDCSSGAYDSWSQKEDADCEVGMAKV
jgi:hypothetical protein